jgi:hypothetical protein
MEQFAPLKMVPDAQVPAMVFVPATSVGGSAHDLGRQHVATQSAPQRVAGVTPGRASRVGAVQSASAQVGAHVGADAVVSCPLVHVYVALPASAYPAEWLCHCRPRKHTMVRRGIQDTHLGRMLPCMCCRY